MTTLADRLEQTRTRIREACHRAGRGPESVRLIAVSKTKPSSLIRQAYEAGQRDFGENYVQEIVQKSEELSDLSELRFHLIGHLQRNKARQIAGLVSAVDTVDSERLARELGKRAAGRPVPSTRRLECAGGSDGRLPVLVEVNVGGEAAKSGCTEEELPTVLAAIDDEPALRLVGLMTVPPRTDSPEGARSYFERLRELQEVHGGATRLPELSMGMSADADVAIACGATQVRIGTAIFGERPPKDT